VPDDRAIDTLNRLLVAEYGSILPHLRQSDPFVSLSAADEAAVVDGLVRDNDMHEKALVALVLDLRGKPAPVRYDIDTTGYHYLSLEHLIPIIVEDVRGLVAAYSSAGSTGNSRADRLIAMHLADYESRLNVLQPRAAGGVA